MKTLVFANMKGGVGKTTAAALFAEGLATFHAQRVLCIDLDPQANLTSLLLNPQQIKKQRDANRTVDQYFLGITNADHAKLKDFIAKPNDHLSFNKKIKKPGFVHAVAAAPRMIDTERVMIRLCADQKRELPQMRAQLLMRLREDLDALIDAYDVVIFDTPPTINLYTEIALLSSEAVIVPIVPEDLSAMGFQPFIGRIHSNKLVSSQARDRFHILLTKYQKRWFAHGKTIEELKGFAKHTGKEFGFVPHIADPQLLYHEDYAASASMRGKSPTFEIKYGRAKANAKAVVKSLWNDLS